MGVALVATILAARWLYIAVPLVYLGAIVAVRDRVVSALEAAPGGSLIPVAFSAVAGIALVFAASLYNFDPVVDQHFTWMAAFGNAAVTHWPPSEPFLMDVPLHYHYLFNVNVGSAAETFHIPLILVASRLAIVFHALAFVLMLYAFCAARLRAGWLGAVAAVQPLLTFGYSAVMWEHFHLATASIMFRVASTIVAFQLFLVLCDEILGLARTERRRTYVLLAFLLLVATGTRAMLVPVLCGGIGLLVLVHLRDRIERRIYATVLGMALASGVLGAVFFLGLGSGESDGTSLLRFSPLNLAASSIGTDRYAPLVAWLVAAGVPGALAALAYLIVAIAGRMTFLLPGVAYAAVSGRSGIDRDVTVMLGGVSIAGITLLAFVETVIPQEICAFYWYADIALALLGAAGLHALWQHRSSVPRLGRATAVALAAVLFAVQAWDFATGFAPKLATAQLPEATPSFRTDAGFEELVATLEAKVRPGDVLVTGGYYSEFDDRVLPAAVSGLRLYASRQILTIYGVRVSVDPRVASRLWLIDDDLSSSVARARVRQDVGAERTLFLLWVGSPPADRSGMTPLGAWSILSLWRVD